MNCQFIAGHPRNAAFAGRRERRPINHGRGNRGKFGAAKRQMCQGDECMGLASAKRCLQPVYGRCQVVARQAQHRPPKDELDSVRRRRPVPEKLLRVGIKVVDPAAAATTMGDDLREARCEISGLKVPWRMPSRGLQLSMMPLTSPSAAASGQAPHFADYVRRNDRAGKGAEQTALAPGEAERGVASGDDCRK